MSFAEVTKSGRIMRSRSGEAPLRDRAGPSNRGQSARVVAVAQGYVLDAQEQTALVNYEETIYHSPSLADGWCKGASQAEICARLWWCGWKDFAISTIAIVALWSMLFGALSLGVYPCFQRRLQNSPSTVSDEEGAAYFAHLLQSTILAILVVAMSGGVLPHLVHASGPVALARPTVEARPYYDQLLMIARAAHIFMCYIVSDLVVGLPLKLLGTDMVIHHTIFIVVSLIITFNCFGALLAGTLLLMEASTPFLNFFLYFRHRWGYDSKSVELSFYFFALCYLVFRLILFPIVCIYFFYHLLEQDTPMNSEVLPVNIGVIGLCLSLAVIVQFVWAVQIMKKVLRFQRRGNGDAEAADVHAKVERMMEHKKPLLSDSSAPLQPPVAG